MNFGRKFELKIERELKNIEDGYFIKSPTPMRIASQNKIIIYNEKALCDFIGIYEEKFILIEAKTITDRFEFRRLKEHQFNQLKKISELGGIAIILFEFIQEEKIYFIKINDYSILVNESKIKSISKKMLEKKVREFKLINLRDILN